MDVLETDFQNVIYKETFNVQIKPELHRTLAVYTLEHDKSLNVAVEEAIENMVG